MMSMNPLDYRNYKDDKPQRRRNVEAFILGMLPGILVVFIFGCLNFSLIEPPGSTPAGKPKLVAIFACAAVIAGVAGGYMLRGPHRRFLFAGFLLGMALASIIEGICYFG